MVWILVSNTVLTISAEFVSSMASVEQQRMSEEVHNARFLCVLPDGYTDKSITEQEAVYATPDEN